jgi:hypothetical protein
MAKQTISVGKFLQAAADGMPEALRKGSLAAAQVATREIKLAVHETVEGRGVVTGNLARSFKTTFLGQTGKDVKAGSPSSLVYAGIQNYGGTIYPRTAKALAVPLRPLPVGKWPRDFPKGELSFIPRKGRPPLLAKVSKNKVEPYFLLKKSVTIRPKNYIEKAWTAGEQEILGIIAEASLKPFAEAD